MILKKLTSSLSILILCVAGFTLTGCTDQEDPAEREGFISRYGGKPYAGTASGVLRSQQGEELYSWNGSASIGLLEVVGDSVSMAFRADFGREGEMNFKTRGVQEGGNYVADGGENSRFGITDGSIGGAVTNPVQEMAFVGSADPTQISMTMEVEFLDDSGDFPEGSVLELVFNASRTLGEEDENGCTLRMVPIWGPNGMTMGMVPDCGS